MQSGKLKQIISIYTKTSTQSASGAVKDQWTLVTTRRAEVTTEGHSKEEQANQMQEGKTIMLKMRYYALTQDHMLGYDGDYFRPFSIIDVKERRHELEVMANQIHHAESLDIAEEE